MCTTKRRKTACTKTKLQPGQWYILSQDDNGKVKNGTTIMITNGEVWHWDPAQFKLNHLAVSNAARLSVKNAVRKACDGKQCKQNTYGYSFTFRKLTGPRHHTVWEETLTLGKNKTDEVEAIRQVHHGTARYRICNQEAGIQWFTSREFIRVSNT
jgi:hypothetical protein